MVMVQKWLLFQHLFLAIQVRKMSFTIFYNEKARFKAIKTRRWKNQKTDIFPKGLSLGFGAKMTIFLTSFFLGNIDEENIFYDILKGKHAFLGYKKIKKTFKKSKNQHFSKGVNSRFWSKKGHFFNIFFLGNIGQENVFYDILQGKNAFLGYKNQKFKKSKN